MTTTNWDWDGLERQHRNLMEKMHLINVRSKVENTERDLKDTTKERMGMKRQIRVHQQSLVGLKVRLANLSMSYTVKKRFLHNKEAEFETMRSDMISRQKAQVELSKVNTVVHEMGKYSHTRTMIYCLTLRDTIITCPDLNQLTLSRGLELLEMDWEIKGKTAELEEMQVKVITLKELILSFDVIIPELKESLKELTLAWEEKWGEFDNTMGGKDREIAYLKAKVLALEKHIKSRSGPFDG